jgi:hypothetical protein
LKNIHASYHSTQIPPYFYHLIFKGWFMKHFFSAALLLTSITSFAGTLDVHCGEIVRAHKAVKNPLFGFSAVKVKLKNSQHFYGQAGSAEGKFKDKFGFTDLENQEKVLKTMRTALREKRERGVPVYACIGEVKGLDRWHKVGSYSLTSAQDAFTTLYEKYGKAPELKTPELRIRIKW